MTTNATSTTQTDSKTGGAPQTSKSSRLLRGILLVISLGVLAVAVLVSINWMTNRPKATRRQAPERIPLDQEPWQRFMNTGDDHYSCGWRITPETRFGYDALVAFSHGGHWLRIKGVVHTDQGWKALNLAGDSLSTTPVEPNTENRLEIISHEPLDGEALDRRLASLVVDGA